MTLQSPSTSQPETVVLLSPQQDGCEIPFDSFSVPDGAYDSDRDDPGGGEDRSHAFVQLDDTDADGAHSELPTPDAVKKNENDETIALEAGKQDVNLDDSDRKKQLALMVIYFTVFVDVMGIGVSC